MGNNYYCDYCNKSFGDKASNRSKHLNSLQHKNARTKHYKTFEDPLDIIKEEFNKKLCKEFNSRGYLFINQRLQCTLITNIHYKRV